MKRAGLVLLVIAVSFSCMLYELIMAQIFSALLGGTLLRYSLTIGLYLAALGLGSFFVRARPVPKMKRQLFRTEIILFVLGGFGPMLIVCIDFALRSVFRESPEIAVFVMRILGWAYPIAIGVISGVELPLLIYLGEDLRFSSGRVLAWDYFGTLLGVAAFSLWLFPAIGVMSTAIVAAAASAVSALLTLWIFTSDDGRDGRRWGLALASVLVLALVALNIQSWNERAQALYSTVWP